MVSCNVFPAVGYMYTYYYRSMVRSETIIDIPYRNSSVVYSDVSVGFQLIVGLDTFLIVLEIGFKFVNFIPCSKIL